MPSSLADVEDEPGHVLGLLEVHPGDRLVEQQQLGIHRQRPPELDSLLDAVGEQGDRILAPLFDLEEVDDVLDPLAVGQLLAPGRTEPHRAGEERAVHPYVATEQQVVDHGHLREQLDVLERAGDAEGGDPVGTDPLDALALPADVTDLGDVDLADGVEDRCLAGTVGPDDREQLAMSDGERHVVDRHHAAEAQLNPIDLQQPHVVGCVVRQLAHDSQRFRRL